MQVSDHDKLYCETENTPLAHALARTSFVLLFGWILLYGWSFTFQFLGLESLGFLLKVLYIVYDISRICKKW